MKTHKIMFLFLALILGLGSSVQAGTPATQTKAKIVKNIAPTKPAAVVIMRRRPLYNWHTRSLNAYYEREITKHFGKKLFVAAVIPADAKCHPFYVNEGCKVKIYYHERKPDSIVHVMDALQTRMHRISFDDDSDEEFETHSGYKVAYRRYSGRLFGCFLCSSNACVCFTVVSHYHAV